MAFVTNRVDGLSHWFSAVQNRASAPAKVCVIGDSISEGVITNTPTYVNRWQGLLQSRLRTAYPVAGVAPSVGYMPSLYADTLIADETSKTGTPVEILTQWGLGAKCLTVNPTQTVAWPAVTCERIRVHYGKSNFLSGGGKVLVDGVDQGVTLSSVDTVNSDGFIWDSGSLTLASHTVTLQGNTSNRFFADGVEFFSSALDATTGVKVYDASHSGARSDTYLTAACDLGHWEAVATLKPNLYIVELGVNDWGNLSPATYLSNMTSLLSKMATANGASPYSVLLCLTYKPVKTNGATDADWAAYRTALLGLATGNVAFMDWQEDWPGLVSGGATNAGLMFETVSPTHPNTAGHSKLADMMVAALTVPPLTVLLDDGTGTFPYDISSSVLFADGFDLSRGRDNWIGAVTAGEATVSLNNSDGRFTPGSTIIGSPSPITVDQRIRVLETVGGVTYTRFTGYVKSWPVSWPATVSTFSTVTVSATDAQARAERRTLRSVLEEEILAASPSAYYTLGEALGSTSAGDTSGNARTALTIAGTGATPTFGTGTGPGSDGLTATQFFGGQYLTGSSSSGWVGATGVWSVGFEITVPTVTGSTVTVLRLRDTSSSASEIIFRLDTVGHIVVQPSYAGSSFGGVASATVVADGNTHAVLATSDGSTLSLYLDGALVGTLTAAAFPVPLITMNVGGDAVGTNLTGTLSHVAVYSSTLSAASAAAIGQVGAEADTARITRIAGYAGVTIGTFDTSLTTVPAQAFSGQSAMEAIQAVTDAAFGLAYVDGTGALTFHNRNRVVAKTAPDLILDKQWVTPDVQPVVDDAQIVNYLEATATGTGGMTAVRNAASDGKHGRYPSPQTYLVRTDQEALDRANWIVGKFAEPTPRYGTLTINLFGMTETQASTVLAALDLDCWLRITSMPTQTPGGTTTDVVVEAIRETRNADTWTIACNVVAHSLYSPVWILGTSSLGVDTALYV